MATFVTVQPVEGEAGVTTVTVTAPAYTGRTRRTDTVTFTTSSNKSTELTVSQAGKPIFFSVQGYDQSVLNEGLVSSSGGTGYIEISTNSRAFFFGWYSGGDGQWPNFIEPTGISAEVVSPVAGTATTEPAGGLYPPGGYYSWKVITATGDPGANNLYTIRVYMTLPANNEDISKTLNLKVVDVDNYAPEWTETFTQPAPISVNQSVLSPTAEGDSAEVTVTSQESWDASVND